MNNQLRQQLREIRLARDLSVKQAARWAGVKERTWRTYESNDLYESSRPPSESALRCFFLRANIQIPNEFRAYLDGPHKARTMSITTLKGGVGKSPITVNVATCLVAKGYKVAVITNDSVYRGMTSRSVGPTAGTLSSQVSYYDSNDVQFSAAEIRELTKSIKENITEAPSTERADREFMYGEMRKELQRKKDAHSYRKLKKNYDYILFDMRYSIEVLRRHTELIAIILDSSCFESSVSADSFITHLKQVRARNAMPSLFGLLTQYDIGGRSWEFEEYVGDRVDGNYEILDELESSRFEMYRLRERLLGEIDDLNLPLLSTRITAAHEVVIDIYNSTRELMDGYCYFHSILDVAPDSYAAREVWQLTEELIDYRL
jgi:cellulose biosynthesis protein BcsQ